MRSNKGNINKETIIETTLLLIDKNNGSKDVTLRDIAKEIGCAHTNLYNYFCSLDQIFWEALAEVLIKELEYASIDLSINENKEERLYLCLSKLVDFSMEHPGWYKLIWLDTLRGEPSPEVSEILKKPSQKLVEMIIKINDNKISTEKARTIANILHGYLHGELCKWINHRNFMNKEQTKAEIMANLKYLYNLMNH